MEIRDLKLSLGTAYTPWLVAMAIVMFLFLVLSPTPTSALTTVPTKMNFQGRLTDSAGNVKANGTYNMRLRLYTVSTGGSAVWSEDRLVSASQGVTVTNGLFSIKLGDVTTLPASLFASGDLYLSVELPSPATATSSSPSWTEGAMTPRNQMATSAYAYNAETLDGLDSASFGQLSASNVWTGTNTFNVLGANAFRIQNGSAVDMLNINTSTATMTVSVDTTIAAGKSVTIVGGNTASRPASPAEGMIYYDTTTKKLEIYSNGKWQADRTDAVLVAASNSSQADKDAADYVADGNTGAAADGDQVQINAALTAGSGKKVVLLAGTYVADATILVPNNTILSGVGVGTLIELADLDATDNLIENSDTTTGTGVVIRNLRIDGRKDLNTAGTQYGIRLNGIGDAATGLVGATIENTTIQNFLSTGIHLGATENSTLKSNSLRYNGEDGIGLVNSSTGNIITANIIYGTTQDGINVFNSSDITISDNIVQSSGEDGIVVNASSRITVTGNTSESNADSGIKLNSATNSVVGSNLVKGNSLKGIYVWTNSNTNVITGNGAHDNGGTTDNNGIVVTNSDSNSITGNTISDNDGHSSTNYSVNITNSTSDTNYLADNILSGGSINNAGTGTIYANQIDSSGQFINRSTGGFAIQDSAGADLLAADSATMKVTIGTSTATDARLTVEGSMTWDAQSAAEANSWQDVTFGARFVAVSSDGTNRVMTSLYGTSWVSRSASEANSWRSVTYGNGTYVAVSSDGTNRVMTSTDSITWTARAAAEANQWQSVTYGNGLFVAVANSGTNRIMTSPDGITWTARAATAANNWTDITYGKGLFVAVSSDGTNRIMTSPNGINWTARSSNQAWKSVTYGNGMFVGVATGSDGILQSLDGITWFYSLSAPDANSWQSIAYGGGKYVAVSSDGTNRTMINDGSTSGSWHSHTAAEANAWNGVAYNPDEKVFVAVASSGTNRVMTSYGDNSIETNGSIKTTGSLRATGELEVGGSVLFKNNSDMTNAFDVQNSSSQSLFTIDTTNAGKVTILGNNGGEIDSWKTNANALPNQRYQPGSATYNGYVYVVGGWGSTTTDYAKLNADGSIGAWQTSVSALPAARHNLGVFVANGYIYAIGGNDTSAAQSTVYYAKLGADGSIGTWRTNANALPAVRDSAGVVTSGGYVYVIGGYNGSASQSTVYYAKLNADGTVGTWQTNANALPLILDSFSTVVANGYIHLIGGYTSSTGLVQSTVYSGKINGDGTVGTWTSAGNGSLPALREYGTSVVNNGYVYYLGGQTTGGVNQSTVYYAKLNSSGVVGSWSTSTHSLPDVRTGAGSIVANGYIYELGGSNGATQTTAYYARAGGVLQVGGSLDLVGLQGQTLADGGDGSAGSTGGSITAGNITAVGSLQVQGQAAFASSASVEGDFNAGNGIFSVETGNSAVRIGSSTADSTGIVLVLDTKNTAGDPTGIEGGMYYNSSSKSFRCYMNGRWRSCVSGVVFANTTVPAAITNTASETNFAQNYSIPADDCQPGRVFRVTAQGVYSIPVTTNPSITLRVKLGSTVIGTAGASALGATALTNRQWRIEFQFICVTSGVSGTVEAGGTFTRFTGATANALWEMNNTAPITINTTTAQTLQVSAQWSAAAAANTITMRQLIVEESGP